MARAPKTQLLTRDHLDGRTIAAKRAKSLAADLASDLGNDLSAAQTVLVRRAAAVAALVEHMEATWLGGGQIDPAQFTTLVNTLTRTLTTLGIHRVPRDVTPSVAEFVADFARSKAASAANAAEAPTAALSAPIGPAATAGAPITGGSRSVPPETLPPPPIPMPPPQ
jgi:hypothetical protein